jgi:hypothetical protein
MTDGMGETYSTHEGDNKYVNNLVENPGVKRELGRPGRRYDNNITVLS